MFTLDSPAEPYWLGLPRGICLDMASAHGGHSRRGAPPGRDPRRRSGPRP